MKLLPTFWTLFNQPEKIDPIYDSLYQKLQKSIGMRSSDERKIEDLFYRHPYLYQHRISYKDTI